MEGQCLAAQEDEIGLLFEGDRLLPEQHQAALRADGREARGHGVHVHPVGLLALEAEQHGGVAAVALAGGP